MGVPVTCYNLGIRRDTSRDILLRWESECSRRLPGTCDGRIVISCGVNDTVVENAQRRVSQEESLENVQQILRAAMKHKIIMVGPPPVNDDVQNERIKNLSEAFARIAKMLDVHYIDLYPSLVSDKDYMREIAGGDGAHPGGIGYKKMAGIIGASPGWWFHAD